MRLIDKLIFKEIVGPFINGLMMFMMLLFAAAYLFPATELLVKGVPVLTVLHLTDFEPADRRHADISDGDAARRPDGVRAAFQ